MVKYESLLLGGKQKKSVGGKMTYEERCKNLEKARATRMANLKKKTSGGGNYTQDYVDQSQINYAGSPLDMYYVNTPEQQKKQRERKGEVKKGMGMAEDMAELTGGKIRRKKKVKEDLEDLIGGRMCKMKGKGSGDSMSFMKESNHTGLDMPTEKQFKEGGAMKRGKGKGKGEREYEHVSGEYKVDLEGAIETLGNLASKFGLRLMK
tara:strand:- start:1311 stop:1931 length:621 start_codon:yes stop_codon:yes gene_type:complete